MFVEIGAPGADLSHILFKHPDHPRAFDLPVGRAWVWYPQAGPARTRAALMVETDPAALRASRRFKVSGFELGHHINDRSYAASSLLAVAIARVFSSALRGQDPVEQPGLAARERPLEIRLPSVRSRGGATLVHELFEPLGWGVAAEQSPLAAQSVDVTLTGSATVQAALAHLYVLLPVLDGAKHYWVGPQEVDKLVRHADQWLATHPARAMIMRRYLAHQGEYVADAAERLIAGEADHASLGSDRSPDRHPDQTATGPTSRPAEPLQPLSATDTRPEPTDGEAWGGEATGGDAEPVATQGAGGGLAAARRDAVLARLGAAGARSVLDLGCGEGRLLADLLRHPQFTRVAGADPATSALARADQRLARLPERARDRLTLFQASATYRDRRFAGFDAIVLSEVVEHLDPDRLAALEGVVFAAARPRLVLVTTPNRDFNPLYGLADGEPRNPDHRFEWNRAEFTAWARRVAAGHGYHVTFDGIGQLDPERGAPTQSAEFRNDGENA
ncbi:MAG: methyltransferase [Bifidobacteriaceae bacterium]|jgi:SAM-dependent methyltransferase|nr:methyltransferase [Bifidobacteriaceae bacterium]